MQSFIHQRGGLLEYICARHLNENLAALKNATFTFHTEQI